MRFFFSVLTLALAVLAARANEGYFATHPALSPDGKTLVFSYNGDLWTVPAEGGMAARLTAMTGDERHPSISPDGKWLAFTADQDGNPNVYVTPMAGGDIVQLTFHDDFDNVDSWSWDSRRIHFTSGRVNNFTAFEVSREGGTPTRLFGNYFNTIHGVYEHPQTGAYYFTDTWESFRFPARKRYKGPYNPDIKSYDPKTGEHQRHTDWEGKDFWHSIDRNGLVYFVSTEANEEYNLYVLRDGVKQQLTQFDESIFWPRVSADGSKVAFVKGYRLHVYDTASKKTTEVDVRFFSNDTLSLARSFDVDGNIDAFDVSPDGKKLAFASRGELFVSDIKGKFVKQLPTAPKGRAFEVYWLADNRTLIYNQSLDGWRNLFTIAADGSAPEKRLTNDPRTIQSIALNSDRTRAVYISGRDEIRHMDLDSFEAKTLVKDEVWGFYAARPYFSPDDRYLAYVVFRDFEGDVMLYDFESNQSRHITKTGLDENNPFWSPDGKDLYFEAGREGPSYPRSNHNPHVYRLPLTRYEAPFKAEKVAELFAEKEKEDDNDDDKDKKKAKKGKKKKDRDEKGENGADKDKEKPEKPKTTIDFERLHERWELATPNAGAQRSPFVAVDGDKTYVFFVSNHDGEGNAVWRLTRQPFEDPKTEKIQGGALRGFGGASLVGREKTLYALINGGLHQMKLGGKKLESIKLKFKFERNMRDEFEQMYHETWANMAENYYNGDFHGVDWSKMRERYAAHLDKVRTRRDLRALLNDLLGELNSSHVGFYSFGEEEETFFDLDGADTGIVWKQDAPFVVERVLARSTADKEGKNIQAGDELIAVNDRPVDPAQNRERYFAIPDANSGRELKLTLRRNGESHQVYIHPQSSGQSGLNRLEEWVDANQRRVDEQSGKRLAYIHMRNMGSSSLNRFVDEMVSEARYRDGLILDLRYNTGGNVHDDVLRMLAQRPYAQWKFREGALAPQPNFAPAAKPIVLLINEQTLSDGEMTAAGFKALGLGKIVGTGTYRWLIFTTGLGLVDGSFHRLPSWGCYTLDGDNLELTGVEPDIRVDNTVKDRLEGADPQLDRAIREAMNQLQ